MSYIRDAVVRHVHVCQEAGNKTRGDELSQEEPRLSVSQIGHCPRQAIFDAVRWHPEHPLHVEVTHPFDAYVMEIMEAGNLWEKQTARALALEFDDRIHWRKSDPALRVGNEFWSGHIDFWIEPCDTYPGGALIEHKATNPINFTAKNRLPYDFHCMQVLVYQRLLQQKIGHELPAYLYYRSWSHWAELGVWDDHRSIVWEGEINGSWRSGEIELTDSIAEEMDKLEYYWQHQELPPRYDTTTTMPFTCARKTKQGTYPSCQYFGNCWPELPQEGPLD